jgi:hypothetical protein
MEGDHLGGIDERIKIIILKWISGKDCDVLGVCVMNNNGFWIRCLDLLAVLYNYKQL